MRTANAVKLYDMSGNVAEWCFDRFGDVPAEPKTDYTGAASGYYRVMRGGGWDSSTNYCALAYRGERQPGVVNNNHDFGFRMALPAS